MQNELVITGMGVVTPLGLSVEAYWSSLLAGQSGAGPITRFNADDLAVRIAAEVKDFHAEELIPRSLERNMALFAKYAFVAAEEALRDAGLTEIEDPERTGIVMGTAMDGMSTLAAAQEQLAQGTIRKVGPRLVPKILGNMSAGLLAMAHGLHGPCMTLNTACSSGGDAIMTAAMLLRSGEADAVLCVGGESIISPILINSLTVAKALSHRNDDPLHASRPFDADRDGFVIGEGGGAILLETAEHAARRGAESYATLAGCANTQDAYHITAPEPHGTYAAACMHRALQNAGLSKEDIGYINAHGTSTPMGDKVEALAIQNAFGDPGRMPYVSSTKGATGHMMGAGGITEVITCIKALMTGIIPPTINHEKDDPDCPLNLAANTPVRADIHAAMSNSLGFGGQNSSIVVTKDKENRR